MPVTNLERLKAIMCCPLCQGDLREDQGGFRCGQCGHVFPQVRGLVRFVDTQFYTGSFGYQWHKYPVSRWGTESEATFQLKTGFVPAEVKGTLVLAVGCGTGRFADVASRLGASEVAAQNLADRPSVAIYQADVFHLPCRPHSFDYIYSIGVLHHTPDCEKAFKTLVPLLKPGGQIAIWLYSSYNKWYRMSDYYRKITSRLPSPVVHAFCQLAWPMYYAYHGLRKIPLVGKPASRALRYMLPMPLDQKDGRMRVLAAFDWYSPKYQSKHQYEEVFRWFEGCGLQDLHVLHEPVSVRGTKA